MGSALIVVPLLLAGCDGGPPMGDVSGKVTYEGKIVEIGDITFIPVDGKTPTAGAPIENGQYRARVPVGLMKVSISAPRVVGKKKLYNSKDSPEMPITEEGLPARFNKETELQFEVQAGTNTKNFELTGK
jgi:hypothetical protein